MRDSLGKRREFRCADRFGLEPSGKGWAYGFRVLGDWRQDLDDLGIGCRPGSLTVAREAGETYLPVSPSIQRA